MNRFWFDLFNLYQPKCSGPSALSQVELQKFLKSVSIEDSPTEEFEAYVDKDWRRFVYTWSLCRDLSGKCLEIGASPYFTTVLLKEFTRLELTLSNYSDGPEKSGTHSVHWQSPKVCARVAQDMKFDVFNVETDILPYPDDHFDVVLFCEVFEHLTNDPLRALMEIRRVLRPGGTLILTTPNAACARNILKIVIGKNIYDRYSRYGPYGRHNREYTVAELKNALGAAGFSIGKSFTANVLFRKAVLLLASFWAELLFGLFSRKRARALGQYIFISASKNGSGQVKRPGWLYRSYAADEMVLS